MTSSDAGHDVKCKRTIGMHSMTGCDSMSAISGRGKRAAFELLKTPRFQNTMSLLGNSFDVSEQLHEECEAFVCALYGKPASWTLMKIASLGLAGGRWYDRTNSLRTPTMQESQLVREKTTSSVFLSTCSNAVHAQFH